MHVKVFQIGQTEQPADEINKWLEDIQDQLDENDMLVDIKFIKQSECSNTFGYNLTISVWYEINLIEHEPASTRYVWLRNSHF